MAALPKKLTSYAAAAGAAAIGLATVANAELQVFDHTSAPMGVGYDADRNMAVLYMDGTYKLHTDGIIEADKTDDAIWFKCRDFMAAGGAGTKGYTGLFAYTGSGAGVAAHPYSGDVGGEPLFEVEHTNDPDLGLEGTETEVHSGLSFTNGHAVMYANGGLSSSPGWGGSSVWADRKGFGGRGFVGFTLQEADGAHYGWTDVGFGYHPTSMTIYGWAYQTTPYLPAVMEYPVPVFDPGDMDEDGDIDSDDIGLLCANLTGPGVPPSDPKYDLDGDGDADQTDMDMLIHDLVEITGGDGTGTEYGDFDLDGDVDTTDLTILATNYGVGTTWALGNANCDLLIDTTDLTILATNFGFVASGAVPEPATLSLLALGAAGLAATRKRK